MSPQKLFFLFITYLLEDEQELSLGMLDTSVAAATIVPRSGGSEALPGTLPEREFTLEAFFITMQASGVMRE